MTPVEKLRDSLLLGGEVYEVPEHEAILAALDVVAAATCEFTAPDLPHVEPCFVGEETACETCKKKAAFEAAVEGATT